MVNHPNRSKVGRPATAPEDRKQHMAFRLSPDVAAAVRAIESGQSAQVDQILRKALIG